MTETEWHQAIKRDPMLIVLRDKASDRKLRLFGCACCWRISNRLPTDLCRTAIAIAELHADGGASNNDLREAGLAAEDSLTVADYGNIPGYLAFSAVSQLAGHIDGPWETVYGASEYSLEATAGRLQAGDEAEERVQCELLRDIFGSPFRPVAVDPSWLTSTVTAIAEGIYAEKAFDRMPILADALHDSGCDNEDVLTHCRSDKPHVKGCWVVDLLLGKQ